jgi:transcriptional regulator with XRE-family HTH domain
VLSVEDWAEIRRLRRAEGLAIQAIARRLGIARNTVKKALASDVPPCYQRAAKGSIVDAVEPRIRALLVEFPDLVGPKYPVRLRRLRVLVDEAAEDRASTDSPRRGLDDINGTFRWSLIQRSMWAVAVVVRGVLAEDSGQMTFTDDQRPVGALSADGAHPALRERVRPGRLRRSPDDADVDGGEHRVEGRGELAISVAEKEPQPCGASVELHQSLLKNRIWAGPA